MNKFPDELMEQCKVKSSPKKIQFIFNKVFDEKNKLGLFNPDFPKPYGKYVILSRQYEYELFLKFNYAKYRATKVTDSKRIRLWLSRAACFKEILAYHNMRLAYKWVRNLEKKLPPEELETEILFALNRAIDKFDTDKGYRFSTFASKVIISEVYTNVKYHNKHIHNSLLVFKGRCKATDGKDRWIYIPDEQSSLENSRCDAHLDIETMIFANKILNERERFILVRLFGLDSEPSQYLWEIGKKLGMCKERVRQLKETALDKIRERFIREDVKVPD